MELLMCFLNAFVLVFFAEIGDKSQFLVMAFSAKYKFKDIILGITIAVFVLNLLAVAIGSYIHNIIPENLIKVFAGILFLIFALISLYTNENNSDKPKILGLPPILAVMSAFFLTELGDKTQVTTMTLAAQFGHNSFIVYILIFLGSFMAMLFANMLGLWICTLLGKCIPERLFKVISVIIFTIYGFLTLYTSIFPAVGEELGTKLLFLIIMLYLTSLWIFAKKRSF